MIDLHEPIKQALTAAQKAFDDNDLTRAAAAYDQASNLMALYAEKALGRDAELRRKKKAVEYREIAQKLRAGELVPADSDAPTAAAGSSTPARQIPAPEKDNEIRTAVSGLIHHSSVSWEDIGGLGSTKDEIKYALGITLARHPAGFEIPSWNNILFYGPPGTGKTLLAAATSNAVRSSEGVPSVFFNVKIASVLSKYFGESSKIISELYGTARDTSPAVIFLDEFEALTGSRDQFDSGPERRILSTLLAELDGMEKKGRKDLYVLTIAATNRPWDLDPAVLSRFEKKILIPLPDVAARIRILGIHLLGKGFQTDVAMEDLADLTAGFSGREIEQFTKEVSNRMVAEMNPDIPALVDQGLNTLRQYELKVRALELEDFENAANAIIPQTSAEDMEQYIQWKEAVLD
jgi:SpoVK/Ycf46/Vps4 family AAA+-type ATPase